MHTVSQLVQKGDKSTHNQMWNNQIACVWVKNLVIPKENVIVEAQVFSFVLVKQGFLKVKYNGEIIWVNANHIHTYASGMRSEMLEVSDDYEAFCLIIDESIINETPLMRHFIKSAYFPVAEFSKPLLSLTENQTAQMWDLLKILHQHILKPATYQKEAILALCEVISIDLLHIQDILVQRQRISTRAEEIFSAFLQLIPSNFIQHRDLQFYAEKLHISTTYLSRIVKQISGRTVMSFIEYALATEAARQLKNTDKSITDLAFDLNFADQASFTKFFTRTKAVSPREFRKMMS